MLCFSLFNREQKMVFILGGGGGGVSKVSIHQFSQYELRGSFVDPTKIFQFIFIHPFIQHNPCYLFACVEYSITLSVFCLVSLVNSNIIWSAYDEMEICRSNYYTINAIKFMTTSSTHMNQRKQKCEQIGLFSSDTYATLIYRELHT